MTAVKRREYRAALRIQKILRGRQGKKRWLAEYWRNEAVVKTQSALEVPAHNMIEQTCLMKYLKQLVIERSRVVREQGKSKGYWKEMYDPMTNRFWYYHYKTGQNTYKCPVVFQKELVCRWMGYGAFGGDEKRCTCVFSDMNDYQVRLVVWVLAASPTSVRVHLQCIFI